MPVDTKLLQSGRFARKRYQEHLDKKRSLALTQEKAASRKRKINEEIRILDEEKKRMKIQLKEKEEELNKKIEDLILKKSAI